MSTLTKHQVVMQRGQRTTFMARDDDTNHVLDKYVMTRDDFLEMGEPDTITVSVEPGDLLNEETE